MTLTVPIARPTDKMAQTARTCERIFINAMVRVIKSYARVAVARENLNDIVAFLAVAREKSFTKAAAQLGVSQSALSHTIRGLESRLGLRLLTRTTRSVSPTRAGERLLTAVGPHFEDIQAEIEALGELRDKPDGHRTHHRWPARHRNHSVAEDCSRC